MGMKTSYTIGEFKAELPRVLDTVQQGGTISITYGRSRRPVAQIGPPTTLRKPRKLGALRGRVNVHIADDWKIDETTFLEG